MIRSGKASIVLVILFLLIIGGITAGFYFYSDYTQKINVIEQQNEIFRQKINAFDANIDSVKQTIQTIDKQFQQYSETFGGLETKIKNNETIVTEVSAIKKNIQDWQAQYAAKLNEFKAKLETLIAKPAQIIVQQPAVVASPAESHSVELGQVTVEKSAN